MIPSARSDGGFRLYTEPDLARLEVIKRMKPFGFTLEEMPDLLQILDAATVEEDERGVQHDRLAVFHQAALARVDALPDQLHMAEGFAQLIQDQIDRRRR
ncbi:hypothetical protein Val02_75140 [Virgisporangium aliadipatigenens]|uniref:HTH merR-type domain-containing protein n=1 Tax=Virgisporangium aliadipatigenens TaxID=741659 RepID=A0A8J3YUB8_9ACTN|nr:MerR family transcriptional regulator [Virgisporangium aliadipatigenens]GIJ50628.1 hypothetical protein Val02_75140 [Virgisporangium aliadipatigenens]